MIKYSSFISVIFLGMANPAMSQEYWPEDLLCSYHPDGQAIIFDIETDEALTQDQGVLSVKFNEDVPNPDQLNETAREYINGHCIGNAGTPEEFRTYAYPSHVIGDFRPGQYGLGQ